MLGIFTGFTESICLVDSHRIIAFYCQRIDSRQEGEERLTYVRSNDQASCEDLYRQSAIEKVVLLIVYTHPSIAA